MTATTPQTLAEVQARIEAAERARRDLWRRASLGEVIGISTAALDAEIATLYATKRQLQAARLREEIQRSATLPPRPATPTPRAAAEVHAMPALVPRSESIVRRMARRRRAGMIGS